MRDNQRLENEIKEHEIYIQQNQSRIEAFLQEKQANDGIIDMKK